jgi:hypothetical protein
MKKKEQEKKRKERKRPSDECMHCTNAWVLWIQKGRKWSYRSPLLGILNWLE